VTDAAVTVDTSLAQESIWLHHQLHPDQPTYNIPLPVRVRGPLRADLVARALAFLVERHELLHSVFALQGGNLVQIIRKPVAEPLAVTQVEPDDVAGIVRTMARDPFDLERGPLLRVRLLRVDTEEHVLVLVLHHIVTDAVSSAILLTELTRIYAALVDGRVPELPELPIQYADYAAFQRSTQHGPELQRLSDYWSDRLAGAQPLDLPTDRPPQRAPSGRGGVHRFDLPGILVDRLEGLARAHRASLFMVLLAGLDVVLSRCTGQLDLTVATPAAGRNRPELESMVGYFINPLLLRIDVSGDPTFTELLERVRICCTEAFDHQNMPFSLVVDLLRRQSNARAETLSRQVILSVQTAGRAERHGAGLVFEPLDVDTGTAKADLLLDIEPGSDHYAARLEYDSDVFDADTVAGIARQLMVVLDAVAANPGLLLSRTPLATAKEHRAIVDDWRNLADASPLSGEVGCLPNLDERPEAPAVIYGDEIVGRAALGRRVASRSVQLVGSGMRRGDTVAVLMPPATDFVVTLLAVWSAGGTVLLLDPSRSAGHIHAAVRAAAPALLVGRSSDLPLGDLGVPVVDTAVADGPAGPEVAPVPYVTPAPETVVQLRYLPVGDGRHALMPVTWSQLTRTASAVAQALGLRADDRCLVSVPEPDDLAGDVVAVLLAGAGLVLPDSAASVEGGWTWAQVDAADATCVLSAAAMPPSHAPSGQSLVPPGLREVVLAAVTFLPPEERQWWRSWPGRLLRLHRFAGTGSIAVGPIDVAGEPMTGSRVVNPLPSGRRWYVLDGDLRPVPRGVIGELYEEEPHTSAAWWHDPARTARVLVPDPYAARPGGRLYWTGDLCRYRTDGSLELRGRADRLAYIAWRRIDLADAEAAVEALDGVRTCSMTPAADAPDASGLRVTIRPLPGAVVDVPAVRGVLRERLSGHPVPSVIVLGESPAVGTLGSAGWPNQLAGVPYVLPQTPFEKRVAQIWAELLDVVVVGLHDNFFDLGGQSLQAVRVATRLREEFDVELAVAADLYPNFTVAAVAELIAERVAVRLDARWTEPAERKSPLVAIPRGPGELLFPASPGQEGVWARLTPDLPPPLVLSGARVRGALDIDRLQLAFNAVAERHETLRSTYHERNGGLVQAVSRRGRIPFTVRGADPDEYREIVRAEVDRGFDLEKEFPIRITVLRLAEDEHIVLVLLHHLVGDGQSIEVLSRDTWAYYLGRPAELPELPVQFADFAQWHRALLAESRADEQIRYWTARLAGATPVAMPSDLTPSGEGWAPAEMLETPIPLPGFQAAVRLAVERRVTLYLVGLTAFAALLARWTGDREICVRAPVSYRDDSQVQDLIADFSNDVVIRLDLSAAATFADLLDQIAEVTAAGFTHRDLPPHLLEPHLPDPGLVSRLSRIQFTTEHETAQDYTVAGLAVAAAPPRFPYAYRPLRVRLRYGANRPRCLWNYQADLFSRERVDRLATDYLGILAEMATDPSRSIARDRPSVGDFTDCGTRTDP
jgi:non-ribosomal peptide synthetase component F/acyl carrier protein